jgi:hypothetical protein
MYKIREPRVGKDLAYLLLEYSTSSQIFVVLKGFCLAGKQALALYENKEDWEFVRTSLTHTSRLETAQALRAVAFVAQCMAESLEGKTGKPRLAHIEGEPPTNYGVQK